MEPLVTGRVRLGLMARAVNCAADRFLTAEFCQAAGYDKVPVEFSGPVGHAVPVLMLTGGLDASNPIENARDVAPGFPDAVVLEVENAAHEALPVPAVQDVVVEFLKGADVRGRRLAAAARL